MTDPFDTLPGGNYEDPFDSLPGSDYQDPFDTLPSGSVSDPFDEMMRVVEESQARRADPGGFLGKTFDVLMRGNYAAAKTVDELFSGSDIGTALAEGWDEVFSPDSRLTFADVIERQNPEFAEEHPVATFVAGFAADIALDPTSYLTLGGGSGAKILLRGSKTFARKVGVEAAESAVAAAAKEVTLSRKGTKLIKKFVKEAQDTGLAGTAARTSAEDKIGALIAAGESGLVDAGGVKFAGKTLISGDTLKTVSDGIGLTSAARAVKNTKVAQGIAKHFSRTHKLPAEHVRRRKKLEARLSNIEEDVAALTDELFEGVSKESREKIGKAGALIEERIAQIQKTAGESGRSLELMPHNRQVIDTVVSEVGLSPEEVDLYGRLRRTFDELAEEEIAAGLLSESSIRAHYFPRYYETIQDQGKFMDVWAKFKQFTSPKFYSRDELRKFETLEEAREAGFDPVEDAMVLYAARLMDSKKQRLMDEFVESTKKLFGEKKKVRKGKGKIRTVTELPEEIADDIQMLGEGSYLPGTNEYARGFWRAWDRLLGGFKSSATVLRPAFWVRQMVGNPTQAYAELGVRSLDPRTFTKDAPLALTGRFDLIDKITTNLGDEISGAQLEKLIREHAIIKNVAFDPSGSTSGIRAADRMVKELDKLNALKKKVGPEHEGLARALTEVAQFTNLPGHVEDFGRVATFINALRAGHAPDVAADIVDKALFDYTQGLSRFERTWVRRFIPFYSFQRFAVPLFARTLLKRPGRVASAEKAARDFFQAYGKISNGDELTEAERHSIPDWVLEQPAALERFDERERAVFRTFNNMSFMDVFGLLTFDTKGELDAKRTAVKGFLSQLVPWIKVPLETWLEEDFFTGRDLPEEVFGSRREKGNLNSDVLFTGLTTALGAFLTRHGVPLKGAAIGAAAGAGLAAVGLDDVTLKKYLGWEEGVDPRTGEERVWINPYSFHLMTSALPSVSDAFKIARGDKSVREHIAGTFFGVGSYDVDLKKGQRYKISEMQTELGKIRTDMRKALRERRLDDFQRERKEYLEYLKWVSQESKALSGPVRGAGV